MNLFVSFWTFCIAKKEAGSKILREPKKTALFHWLTMLCKQSLYSISIIVRRKSIIGRTAGSWRYGWQLRNTKTMNGSRRYLKDLLNVNNVSKLNAKKKLPHNFVSHDVWSKIGKFLMFFIIICKMKLFEWNKHHCYTKSF